MRILSLILSFVFTIPILKAQESPSVKPLTIEQRAQNAANELQEKLSLSEDQKAKITKIQLKFFKQLDKLKGNFTNKTPKEQNVAVKKMQVLNTSREKSIMKLLTEEQKTIFENTISASKAVKKEILPPKEKKSKENNNLK